MNTISKHMAYYLLLAAVGLFVFIMLSGHAQAAETSQTASQTLTASLQDIIQQVTSGVKQGVSFLQQEIPDVIKQLLMWKAAKSGFFAIFWTLLFSFGVWCVLNALKRMSQYEAKVGYYGALKSIKERRGWPANEEEKKVQAAEILQVANAKSEVDALESTMIASVVAAVIFGLIGIGSFFAIWGNALEVLQIYIAPKVWLIEYAASLVK